MPSLFIRLWKPRKKYRKNGEYLIVTFILALKKKR